MNLTLWNYISFSVFMFSWFPLPCLRNLGVCVCVCRLDSSGLGQGVLMITVMNLRVLWNVGNFLTNLATVIFWRRSLLHGNWHAALEQSQENGKVVQLHSITQQSRNEQVVSSEKNAVFSWCKVKHINVIAKFNFMDELRIFEFCLLPANKHGVSQTVKLPATGWTIGVRFPAVVRIFLSSCSGQPSPAQTLESGFESHSRYGCLPAFNLCLCCLV
jgi:hypothetical protein